MIFFRHFKDEDNLQEYGFNPPLIAGQDTVAVDVASQIKDSFDKKNLSEIVIYTSTKLRCMQSAEMVGKHLQKSFNVKIIPNKNLNWIDDGKINVPDDYAPKTFYPILFKAWEIFINENLANNTKYRLGDPSGSLKYYKELNGLYDILGGSMNDIKSFFAEVHNDSSDCVVCGRSFPMRVLLAGIRDFETKKIAKLYDKILIEQHNKSFPNLMGRIYEI